MLIAGLVVIAALVASQAMREPDAPAPVAAVASSAATVPPPMSQGGDAMPQPVSPSAQNVSTPASRPSQPVVRKAFAMPELARSLPEQGATVNIGDREWRVLGSRELVNASGTQTVLVLRDEASGQLDYRQSALRFVLNEGQDYEAFIRSRSNATRLFANPLYGDIAVDAANIAAEYTALSTDSRVSKVMFIPLDIKPKAK